MSSDIKTNYGSSAQLITCLLAPSGTGLANNAARQSTAIDNSTDRFLDASVFIKIKTAGSISATGAVNIYAYGTVDGGTTYTEGCSGTDGPITLVSPTNLRIIGVINAVTTALPFPAGPFSVAAAFGGILPQKWGIVIENRTGAALDTTEANHLKIYQGSYATAS